MSGINHSHQDVDIDLGGLVGAIWKRRWRVLTATVVFAGLAFVGASLMSPQYRSETRILIESRQPEFTGPNANQPADRGFDDSAITSQVQLLQSVDLIKQVARDMKLYELKEFDPTADPSAVQDILVMLGLQKNPLELPPEERVLKVFEDKLQVYQVDKSRVIGVQFTSKDPRLAAAIPNEIARVYQILQSGAKLDSNTEASRWLEPEIANLREKVRDAEAKVADYRASSDLLATGEAGGNFATKQLNDISTELVRVRGERANAQARAQGVRATLASGRSTDTLNDVVGSPMIQRLKESESGIQNQIADLSTTMLDGHPRLKALKSQLQGIRQQIVAETQKILSSLENEVKVAELRERELTQQLNVLKATSAKAGEDEVGLRALEREAAAQRQLLETYLARYREATSRTGENAVPADARIISTAVIPTEANFPKVVPITIVAGLAAFLVSSIIVMLSELFSGRALRPVGRMEDEEVVPVSATPRKRQPVGVASSQLQSALDDEDDVDPENEAFLVETVADELMADDARIVMCTSPDGDDGSAHVVLLARTIADRGRRIVLIDLTGSGYPSVHMQPADDLPGITNLLAGEVPFTETIHADQLSEAHIIPQGDADPLLAMKAYDRLQMIIDALSNAYETVMVDCGAADVPAISRVTRPDETRIVISAPIDDRTVMLIERFAEAGYTQINLVTGTVGRLHRTAGRYAA